MLDRLFRNNPAAAQPPVVEDVFSTWLYTGNSSTQTIANGINLAGDGGLVWVKERSNGIGFGHYLFDSARGLSFALETNSNGAQANRQTAVNAFNSNGFAMGSAGVVNNNGTNYTSWTFRKAPKFFDVVTYTGNGVSGRQIAHNLTSEPGCIIIKAISVGGTPSGWSAPANWWVFHRGLPSPGNFSLRLNTTAAQNNSGGLVATSSTFTVFGATPDSSLPSNVSGVQYVAYLFAHDTASDGFIQCGSYAGTGAAGQIATLGWEPQWVMIKAINGTTNWPMYDSMRGMTTLADGTAVLDANTTNGESILGAASSVFPTATGFGAGGGIDGVNQFGGNYIYIAIRRGPMRTPTVGTQVFSPTRATFNGSTVTNTGFVVDMVINKIGVATTENNFVLDRLRGSGNGFDQRAMSTHTTNAEGTSSGLVALTGSVTIQNGFLGQNTTANNSVWAFRRAPGFFDEVCYTGTGVARTVNHNLGVVPEMMIIKNRSFGSNWITWTPTLNLAQTFGLLALNDASGVPAYASSNLNSTLPTSTVFTVSGASNTNSNNYVAYLFASVPGVSRVGSYTGNGTSQTIDCGFTTGARYFLVKRTNATGDWWVWDSARGITAPADPALRLNSNAAEVTGADSVDPTSVGIIVNQDATTNINVSGGSYIYLAIS